MSSWGWPGRCAARHGVSVHTEKTRKYAKILRVPLAFEGASWYNQLVKKMRIYADLLRGIKYGAGEKRVTWCVSTFRLSSEPPVPLQGYVKSNTMLGISRRLLNSSSAEDLKGSRCSTSTNGIMTSERIKKAGPGCEMHRVPLTACRDENYAARIWLAAK